MIDGVKILDVSLSTKALLRNDRLLFPLQIDEQTGAVLNRPRRATDSGLTFTLIPKKNSNELRCELQGSLHRYHNDGCHNATDFTAAHLLSTINNLVQIYGINPFESRINNVEFGVNIRLPFPVADILNRLICYQGVAFVKDTKGGDIYYQATKKQYVVKMYDKGRQFGLRGNILRFEIKVFKMQFLTAKGIDLVTVSDLLKVKNYVRLGKLLLDALSNVLLDEPAIDTKQLTAQQRELLLQGRNPRYWSLPARETFNDIQHYNRERKRLQRQEKRFRNLLDRYRMGEDLWAKIAELVRTKWEELTAVSSDLLNQIHQLLNNWKKSPSNLQKCPNITGLTNVETNAKTTICPKITL